MANVKLDWIVPSATDIESIKVFRFTGDYSALTTADSTIDLTTDDGADGRILDAASASKFVGLAGASELESQTFAAGAGTYEDSTAVIGETYVYGVFSHNSGGYGPGELELQTV
jgi:hypothetical protein